MRAACPSAGLITGPNEATFSVRRPRNFDDAKVHGAEVNFVYSFTQLPGWLERLRHTAQRHVREQRYVLRAGFEHDLLRARRARAIRRTSTLFYENPNVLRARLAYNRREGFLEQLVTSRAGWRSGVSPHVRSDGPALELHDHGSDPDLPGRHRIFSARKRLPRGASTTRCWSYIDTGARWAVGARANF